jgi:hypothetical protein
MADWNLAKQNNELFFNSLQSLKGIEASSEYNIPNYDQIVEALSHISLLYDVPFAYLVPKENMLSQNQIKFFYLDTNWIKYLLDGACSIGRVGKIDYANDVLFLAEICKNALNNNINIRKKKQGKPLLGKEELASLEDSDIPVCTGFLLRSELVKGWRGLEFIAYGDPKDSAGILTALRLETISKDILLGIYKGVIKKLDIKQPPEGFHYGFNRYNNAGKITLNKSLRGLDDGKLIYKNQKTVEVEVVQRNNRVINFRETAKNMANSRDLFKDGTGKMQVNSAHIALEMIQNPYIIEIIAE